MKTRLIYALSALVMLTTMLVTSCKKDDPVDPKPPITIPSDFKNLSLEEGAFNKEVKFVATTNWSVTLEETTKAAPSWLTVSPMSGGAGNVTLKIDVKENTNDKERSSIVKINAGDEQYSITVTQKEKKVEVVAVTGVTLNNTTLSLIEGKSETLTATVAPENADNLNVTWSSSDDEVATVVEGKVTAIKAGTATITVTTEDGAKTATCEVTVIKETVAVIGVTLNPTTLSFVIGSTEAQSIDATVAPANATNKNVTWKSSNTAVVTVNDNGEVTLTSGATAGQTATITVTTEDGAKTATCDVSVTATSVNVTEVTLNNSTLSIIEGETADLIATVNPSNATNKNITWESNNTEVATVTNGVITAIKAGVATITVTTKDGEKTATCDVTVIAKATVEEGNGLDDFTQGVW